MGFPQALPAILLRQWEAELGSGERVSPDTASVPSCSIGIKAKPGGGRKSGQP